ATVRPRSGATRSHLRGPGCGRVDAARGGRACKGPDRRAAGPPDLARRSAGRLRSGTSRSPRRQERDRPGTTMMSAGPSPRKRAAIADPKSREFLRKADPILAGLIDARPDFRPRAWMDA